MRIFYHRTSRAQAELILRNRGFLLEEEFLCRNADGTRSPGKTFGVWLSDRPLYLRGTQGHDSALLEVVAYASDGAFDQFEWRNEPTYREWCIPPEKLNPRIISLHLMTPQEERSASLRMMDAPTGAVPLTAQLIHVGEDGQAEEYAPPQLIDLNALFPNTKELSAPSTRARLALSAVEEQPKSRSAKMLRALHVLKEKSMEALREQSEREALHFMAQRVENENAAPSQAASGAGDSSRGGEVAK